MYVSILCPSTLVDTMIFSRDGEREDIGCNMLVGLYVFFLMLCIDEDDDDVNM